MTTLAYEHWQKHASGQNRRCIHKGRGEWAVYDGPKMLIQLRTLTNAYNWARRFLNTRSAD